jgi:hypothetical protein
MNPVILGAAIGVIIGVQLLILRTLLGMSHDRLGQHMELVKAINEMAERITHNQRRGHGL